MAKRVVSSKLIDKELGNDLSKLLHESHNEFIAAISILFASEHEVLFIKWLHNNKARLNALASGNDFDEIN